jgi:type VI secretion system secreted protein VgrG
MTVTGIAFITLAAFGTQAALAATATVNLGTSAAYAVLAGSTITNTGPTSIGGDIGLSPGTAVTGFPPGSQTSGTMNVTNAAALGAENDLITASVDAAGRTPFTTVTGDLGGTTLVGGVYQSASSMALTGSVTLNGAGDPNTVWIFQAGTTLTTASASHVVLENDAQACNVFWQVGSSATLGTTTNFAGTIMATQSITLDTNATVNGRVLALNGAVTMDTNTIDVSTCSLAASPTTTSTTVAGATTTTTTAATAPVTTTTDTATNGTVGTPTTFTVGALSKGSTTSTFPLPIGAPETGAGGTARSGASLFWPIGLAALGLAGITRVWMIRARSR